MRGPAPRWVTLLTGLAVGLAVALIYTRLIDPVQLTNTYPALLRSDHRRDWVRLAALSFVAEGDLPRTRARLDGLDRDDIRVALQRLLEDEPAAGAPSEVAHRLSILAEALDVPVPATMPPALTPAVEPTRTLNGAPSGTPYPATAEHTPTSTPGAPTIEPTSTPPPTILAPPSALSFGVTQQEHFCRPDQPPRIEVVVTNAEGDGLPRIGVWLLWADGANWAVTGLKPAQGAGYADLGAEPGTVYSLGLGEIGMPLVTNLQLRHCPVDGDGVPTYGSWRITIKQRAADTGASSTPQS